MRVPDSFDVGLEMRPDLSGIEGRSAPDPSTRAKAAVRALLEADLNGLPHPKLDLSDEEYEYVCRCFDGYRARDALEKLRNPHKQLAASLAWGVKLPF